MLMSTSENKAVARPLNVLAPLIKQDFEQGDAAAEKAGMPYYKAAGEKLIEAREGSFAGDSKGFYAWAEKTFKKKPTQIKTYMAVGETTSRKSFGSLRDFERNAGRNRPTSGFVRREWTGPVDAVAEKARDEQRRLLNQQLITERERRAARAKLGLRLIDIGYKVLAKELHPDKLGGSKEAMVDLNWVRERLKAHV